MEKKAVTARARVEAAERDYEAAWREERRLARLEALRRELPHLERAVEGARRSVTHWEGHLAHLATMRTGFADELQSVEQRLEPREMTAGEEDRLRRRRTDGIYALATNLRGPLTPTRVLRLYKSQFVVEQRHRGAKQTLRVRPLFLHNDDRLAALISVVGLALLVFGIIEARVRHALGPGQSLPGILPEGRAALPTGRSIFAAFQGLGLTYTDDGPRLDPLTATQRRIPPTPGRPHPVERKGPPTLPNLRKTRLAQAERDARAAGRGLWLDANPVAPWQWRRQKSARDGRR